MIIRKATVFDHSEILRLCVEWFKELSVEGMPGYCDYSGIWLADLIANHIVIVGELDGKIIGMIALRIANMPWNLKEKLLFNDGFMTYKQYRKTGIASKLLEIAKDSAKELNMCLIMGHMTGTDAELKDRYFKTEGFKYAGANFIYRG